MLPWSACVPTHEYMILFGAIINLSVPSLPHIPRTGIICMYNQCEDGHQSYSVQQTRNRICHNQHRSYIAMNDTDCDKAISDFGTSTCMFVIPTEPCGT